MMGWIRLIMETDWSFFGMFSVTAVTDWLLLPPPLLAELLPELVLVISSKLPKLLLRLRLRSASVDEAESG